MFGLFKNKDTRPQYVIDAHKAFTEDMLIEDTGELRDKMINCYYDLDLEDLSRACNSFMQVVEYMKTNNLTVFKLDATKRIVYNEDTKDFDLEYKTKH